ncbi:WAP four-disulfide core domain protein 2-like [Hyla sarda]|uniref:WAP four-disulfide core domain protein 2-like n=1 Tax=Hyla sarda TaxID=327740 RepID=UPI0024C302F0|nr:WAP four-disulfide core domain protein 2-like [Hyla sarda]
MKPMRCIPLLLILALCVQRRAAQTTAPAAQHTGVCPQTEDIKLGICGNACDADEECADKMKCCPNNCGTKSCTKTVPAELPSTTEPPKVFGNETAKAPAHTPNNHTGNE